MPTGGGWEDPDVLIKIWKERFSYFYREYDYFIFPMWYVRPNCQSSLFTMLIIDFLAYTLMPVVIRM